MIKGYLGKKELYFIDKVCFYCNYVRPDRIDDRYFCVITNELMFNIKKELGQDCPIEFKEGE